MAVRRPEHRWDRWVRPGPATRTGGRAGRGLGLVQQLNMDIFCATLVFPLNASRTKLKIQEYSIWFFKSNTRVKVTISRQRTIFVGKRIGHYKQYCIVVHSMLVASKDCTKKSLLTWPPPWWPCCKVGVVVAANGESSPAVSSTLAEFGAAGWGNKIIQFGLFEYFSYLVGLWLRWQLNTFYTKVSLCLPATFICCFFNNWICCKLASSAVE